VGDEATNSTKICTTVYMVNGNRFTSNGSSCELQINRQACVSCTYTVDFSHLPQGSSEVLESKADCSNVVDGLMIDSLYFGHLPIMQACHKPINGSDCDLCADNEYIADTDTTAISLDGFGSDFTCAGLNIVSNEFLLSSDKCVEATILAQAECCKALNIKTSVPRSTVPSSEPTSTPLSPAAPSTAAPMSPAASIALSFVSAANLLTGTSFVLAMN